MSEDFANAPDPEDPAQMLAGRTMDAIQRAFAQEFAGESQAPNVTIVVSYPPAGRVGVASTEPDAPTVLEALGLGLGAVRHAVRLRAERQ